MLRGEKCKSASTVPGVEVRWHGEWDGWCRNTSLFIFKTDNFNGAGNAAVASDGFNGKHNLEFAAPRQPIGSTWHVGMFVRSSVQFGATAPGR